MRTVLIAGCVAFSFSTSAVAEEALGRVHGVYFEAARGVLVDRPSPGRGQAPRWLDVELEKDKRRLLVQLPGEMQAGIGDLVVVQLVDPAAARFAALHRGDAVAHASRVTEVRPRSVQAVQDDR